MIKRLYVHNYRCFENFTLDFEDQPSLLVIGKNGSGKSTLKSALEVLQKIGRGVRSCDELVQKSDFGMGRTDVPIRFEIEFELDGHIHEYKISFWDDEQEEDLLVYEEILLIDSKQIFSCKEGSLVVSGNEPIIVSRRSAVLAVLGTSISGHSGRIRNCLSSLILTSPIPANMSGFTEKETNQLESDASNFASWFASLLSQRPAAYSVIENYIRDVIPDLESFENVPRGEKGKQLFINFQHDDSGKPLRVDFKNLSDGEKCFFLSALIIAASKYEPIFCFWDEPDNHLSLPEVQHFVTALRKMANNNGQLIVTSHHPETIRSFSDENTLVFYRNSHLEPTVVKKLEDVNYKGDLINALIRDEIPG